jgi:hypothetical protein
MELAVQDFAVPVTTAVDYKSAVTVFSLGMPDEKWPGHDIPRSQIQQCPDVDVIFPRRWTGKLHRAQACAHVVDAKQLAEHSDLLGKATWNEHAGDACATGNLVQAAAADLQTLLPSATDRNDPAKVTQAVCLAAAASRKEGVQYDGPPSITWLGRLLGSRSIIAWRAWVQRARSLD